VVIAGEIVEAEKVLLPAIEGCINAQALKAFRKNLPVVRSTLIIARRLALLRWSNAPCSTVFCCSVCWKADRPYSNAFFFDVGLSMTIQNVICDIDGVLMHDNVAVPGAAEFIKRILDKGMPLVLLTNYPSQTGQDLANRFATAGVDVPDSVFYTSAMATADFLRARKAKKPTWWVKAR
jgi:hypothetical protein